MTLQDYCTYLGWNIQELARQADINRQTARNALIGEEIKSPTARKIASALSTALGKTIHVGDIQGLNIRG